MKKITWDNPNKMHIETGHRTFDRQTNLISTGNIVANTIIGRHVRAHNNLNGWDGPCEPGYLQDFDLSSFRFGVMPSHVREYIKSAAVDESVWVYHLFHYNGNRRIIHGWVITSHDHKPLRKFVIGPTRKSYDVVYEAAKYLEEEDG